MNKKDIDLFKNDIAVIDKHLIQLHTQLNNLQSELGAISNQAKDLLRFEYDQKIEKHIIPIYVEFLKKFILNKKWLKKQNKGALNNFEKFFLSAGWEKFGIIDTVFKMPKKNIKDNFELINKKELIKLKDKPDDFPVDVKIIYNGWKKNQKIFAFPIAILIK